MIHFLLTKMHFHFCARVTIWNAGLLYISKHILDLDFEILETTQYIQTQDSKDIDFNESMQ